MNEDVLVTLQWYFLNALKHKTLGVLLTFWELPCRASPEEDFQPQQKKKDAFRVWAGL